MSSRNEGRQPHLLGWAGASLVGRHVLVGSLLGLPSVKHFDYIARVVDCPAVFALRVKVANLLMLLSHVVALLLVHGPPTLDF
jgi:hypothetical protein